MRERPGIFAFGEAVFIFSVAVAFWFGIWLAVRLACPDPYVADSPPAVTLPPATAGRAP